LEIEMSKQNLEQKIAAALSNGHASSETFAELVTATEAAVEEAQAMADQLKQRALDINEVVDVSSASTAIMAHELLCDRLKAALPKLRDRMAGAVAAEIDERWRTRAQRLQSEANALGREFTDTYSQAALTLLDLFQRMANHDKEVREHNSTLPAGTMPVRSAELARRTLDAFSRDTPSITATVTLCDPGGRVVWPPPKAPLSTIVQLPTIDHGGPRWHEDLERKAEQRREEWERTVQWHEQQAKQLEEGPTAA
jgi:superoxide dismutase